jgi:glycosyltransferase involved in cell wall biosynthesis
MRVCLVGHSAGGLLDAAAGGSERQTALLARELAARGHDVSLVTTMLTGGGRTVDGVRIVPAWDPHRGLRFVRAATYRYPRLYGVLRAQSADVYYSRGAGFYTPFVIRAARDQGARSVLALASDRDLYASSRSALFAVGGSRLSPLVAWLAHAAYRHWALPAATCVAVQNREQATACEAFGLRNVILPNILVPPPDDLAAIVPDRDVVWAGNVLEGRRSKGLDEVARLARLLPDVGFTVAGMLEGESHQATIELLRSLANVRLTGSLAHVETQRAIAGHRLVINTSPSEGFSNVMLEGWALGKPSVTLAVNPSGLLTGDRLGVCAGGDLEAMAAAVAALLAEPEVRAAMGDRGREYVRETHAPARVCAAFEQLVTG